MKAKDSSFLLNRHDFLVFLLLAILCFSIFVAIAPHLQPIPATDSSIFLYTGDQILEGQIPYRDVWDHKGPLIYYINALGLLSGSRWGVWLLEVLFVLGSVWVSFRLLRSVFGFWPAVFASTLFVTQIDMVLDRGNLVEEYALLFQSLCLLFFWWAINSQRREAYFAIGLAASFCFLLRPNIIGIPIAIAVFFAWQIFKEKKEAKIYVRRLFAIFLGALVPLAIAILYFLFTNALAAFWDAAFTFNFIYATEGDHNFLQIIRDGLQHLLILAPVSLAGWALLINQISKSKNSKGPTFHFLFVLTIALPVEIFLTTLSGHSFLHYFLSWLPVLTALSAFFAYLVSRSLNLKDGVEFDRRLSLALILGFALTFALPKFSAAFPETVRFFSGRIPPSINFTGHRYESVLDYLFENAEPSQTLLMLGNAVAVNWLTDIPSPVRFVYQSPLLIPEYGTEEKIDSLIMELQGDAPIIIDTNPAGGFLPAVRVSPDSIPLQLQPLYQFINQHYVYAGTFEPLKWDLYLYQGQGVFLENANAP